SVGLPLPSTRVGNPAQGRYHRGTMAGSEHKEVAMRVCLFEDGVAALEPLSLTRPVFELRCGLTTLAEKHLRLFGPWPVGVLIRPHLAELYRAQYPDRRVNDVDWLRAGTTMLVNGRWLPPTKPALAPR